ncbi:MAG: FAD-dependent oxidoreductase [Coriobacteriales bacterium]|jgi:fumarate reductase flavoprotein subunit
MFNESVSRRYFLRSAALGVSGIAATSVAATALASQGLAAESAKADGAGSSAATDAASDDGTRTASFMTAPAAIPDSQISQTVDVDIVVVGAGPAGEAAALAASQEGAKVALLEKGTIPTFNGGDVGAFESQFADRFDYSHDAEGIVHAMMKESQSKASQDILTTWLRHSGATFDWVCDQMDDIYILEKTSVKTPNGAGAWIEPERYPLPEPYEPRDSYYGTWQTTYRLGGAQSFTYCGEQMVAKAEATGNCTTYYSTSGVQLVRGTDQKSGRVTALIAKTYEGEYIKFNAAKAVILCTGDYTGDDEMFKYYLPWYYYLPTMYSATDPDANPANTGDGDKMGMWVGAKMDDGPHAGMAHTMGGPLGCAPMLMLNLQGKRFMNEDIPGQEIQNQMATNNEDHVWQFFDSAWPDEVGHMGAGHGQVIYELQDTDNQHLSSNDGFGSQAQIDQAVEAGTTVTADTIEDLVAATDIEDKDAAVASIKRYNELAEAGEDTDFYKNPNCLYALKNPPYYACKFNNAGPLLVSSSGLTTNMYGQVLDADNQVIEGLYAAGNNQGGRFVCGYPTTVPGISRAYALTYGRIEGIIAAHDGDTSLLDNSKVETYTMKKQPTEWTQADADAQPEEEATAGAIPGASAAGADGAGDSAAADSAAAEAASAAK